MFIVHFDLFVDHIIIATYNDFVSREFAQQQVRTKLTIYECLWMGYIKTSFGNLIQLTFLQI